MSYQQPYGQQPPPQGYYPPPGGQYPPPQPMQYQQPPPQEEKKDRGCLTACLMAMCCCFLCEETCECCIDQFAIRAKSSLGNYLHHCLNRSQSSRPTSATDGRTMYYKRDSFQATGHGGWANAGGILGMKRIQCARRSIIGYRLSAMRLGTFSSSSRHACLSQLQLVAATVTFGSHPYRGITHGIRNSRRGRGQE
ncbi:hypothetical protein ABOM_001588 [Aspergillus bombycis]|uniref:Cysteine-rich transmembrane domain-containing protein n=2 Tax=Aspergillus TaxID=5052 RepID=A0A1F8AEU0_9EURO|nr:hypothetical protein ABOM_001588 [Aspergillus bombycis]OGM49919.1 hypothetical protein ABOM_001588 [Aspergillus bombycis]